jgi:hypothetical protein
MISNFLVFLPDRYDYQQRLLPYVSTFINDASSSVQSTALGCIEKCGWQYESEHPDDVIERLQLGIDGDRSIDYNSGLPEPFTRRPSLGARLFVRSNTSRFYLAVLSELSNWRGQTRKRSADLLLILSVYCEEHLTKDFQHTINSITKAIEHETGDDNESSHLNTLDSLRQVVCLMSKYIDPAAWFPILSPRISGDCSSATSYAEDGSHSEKTRRCNMIILSSLIQGSPLHRLLPFWQKMILLLISENCIGIYAGSKVQVASLNALTILIERVIGKDDTNQLVTFLKENGKASETCGVLKLAQDALLQNGDRVAKECAYKISPVISLVNDN